jgi:hypothetical protein
MELSRRTWIFQKQLGVHPPLGLTCGWSNQNWWL